MPGRPTKESVLATVRFAGAFLDQARAWYHLMFSAAVLDLNTYVC